MIVFDFVVLNNLLFLLLMMVVTTATFSAFCAVCRIMYVWCVGERAANPAEEGINIGVLISVFCWSIFTTISLIRWFIRIWF